MSESQDGSNYAQQRMEEIGFDPSIHQAMFCSNPDEPFGSTKPHPLMWPDEHGNLCIGIIDPNGNLISYDKSDSASRHMWRPFYLKRLADPFDGIKYLPCVTGMGVFPYVPVQIYAKFNTGRKIKSLIITEGYIKAFVGANHGIDIVGIPGINVWNSKSEREKKKVFDFIEMIVQKCNVKEIIFLTDADTLKVRWQEDKDLYKRPSNFYRAVVQFKEKCRDFEVDLYFSHIKTDSKEKGLDDLVLAYPDKVRLVKKDLLRHSGEKTWFSLLDVSSTAHSKIRRYFHIETVEDFYKAYEQEIGLKKFLYKNGQYQWDDDTDSLNYIKRGEAARFVRVGKTFYIKGAKPFGKRDLNEKVLRPITKDEIRHMFKKQSKGYVENICLDIDYYHGATNIPSHHKYQEFIETKDGEGNKMVWYNLYKDVNWIPLEGGCPKSIEMIKHIFGSESINIGDREIPAYELGFDYVKVLWEQPMHSLPILVLYSKARATGKTTFWNWMRAIFQQNARAVRAEHLGSQFTSFFAMSLLAIVDEALVDKRHTVEKNQVNCYGRYVHIGKQGKRC